ncbi:MAG: cytochrome c [Chloroflexota bacterium]|nr:cytochrome c [Chloroflexota bacterium]
MIRLTKKFNKTHLFLMIVFSLIVLAPTCQSGITQRGTYPIEIFSEMHYSQAYRNQESPRLESLSNAEPFVTPNERLNDSESVLDMDSKFIYNPKIGAEIYRVNCSFCHGINGMGDGTAAPHISSEDSFYATTPTDEVPGSGMGPYKAVPQLHNLADRLQGKDKALNRLEYMLKMEAGSIALGPMPSFLWVFTEEQRSQIINYIVDEKNGLAANSN